MAKRVTIYLVSGDMLHYYRPDDTILDEKRVWMDLLNNESMSCALAGKWVIPKSQIKYVEFDTDSLSQAVVYNGAST